MSSKECFHFTYLNRAFSINETGLNPRLEDNSKALKDSRKKLSFSDGRYAAAALMANFYKEYTDIKTGKRDKNETDPELEKKIKASKSFEDFLGKGMYLIFDGTEIENTGGNKGHINPFDAGTQKSIAPDELKVCMLKDKDGNLLYSKFDFALYLMMNLTQEDYSKMPDELIDNIKNYKESHVEDIKRLEESKCSIEFMDLEAFCEIYKNEIKIEAEIENQKVSMNDNENKAEIENPISMEDLVKNSIINGIIIPEDVKKIDNKEIDKKQEKSVNNEIIK